MEIVGRISQLTRLAFDNVVLDITFNGDVYSVQLGDRAYQVEVRDAVDGRLDLLIEGRQLTAYVSVEGQYRWITVNGRTVRLERSSESRRESAAHEGPSELIAPMPGQVRAVNVAPGDPVTKGQVLIILEAMKMEIRLQAPFNGLVLSVAAAVGQTVDREQVLVRLNRSEPMHP